MRCTRVLMMTLTALALIASVGATGVRAADLPKTGGANGAPVQQPAAPASAPSFGIVGQGSFGVALNPALLQAERNAGVSKQLVELAWNDLQPDAPGGWSSFKAGIVQTRIDALLAAVPDMDFYLDLGLQYPPAWASAIDPLMDQYGNRWVGTVANGGGVNVYWSPTLRGHIRTYIQQVFTNLNFHGHLWAVRIGPSTGELLYPQLLHAGQSESFWAFDPTAQAQSPVPGWRPGQASPNGEAQRFYYWYVDHLADTFNFMLTAIRPYFSGYVAPVTPGTGMCAEAANRLIAANLSPTASMYYGTGNYWERIFPLMGPDPNILHWASSVGDMSGSNENSPLWWEWSSAKALAYLAQRSGRPIYAENPGRNPYDTSGGADPRTTMQWVMQAVRNYNYLGLMWVREAEMSNPAFANLPQYAAEISQAAGTAGQFGDVSTTSPFYAVITDLVARGAISGYGDGSFRPGAIITRGQVAKVLVVARGLTPTTPPRASFSDVPLGSAFSPYVETAYTHGIIGGYSDGTFRPAAPVTRAQLAKMTTVGMGWAPVTPATPTFSDVPSSDAFYTFVETAYRHGVISGYGCGGSCLQFRPGATATRGQGSKIVDLAITSP
jgi:hypothetical protein